MLRVLKHTFSMIPADALHDEINCLELFPQLFALQWFCNYTYEIFSDHAITRSAKALPPLLVAWYASLSMLTSVSTCTSNLNRYCDVVDVAALSLCTNLHTLDLSYCRDLDISGLSGCNLKTLNLSFCASITSVAPLSECLNLEYLDLSCCTLIDLMYLDEPPIFASILMNPSVLLVSESKKDETSRAKIDSYDRFILLYLAVYCTLISC